VTYQHGRLKAIFPEYILEHDKSLDSCHISVGETLFGMGLLPGGMTAVIPLIAPYMIR